MTRTGAPISPPVVLTIAGSDSGGGAGIQADLKTIEACGGFGTSAITSVTAQNSRGVQGAHHLPPDDVEAQIEAVRDDFDVAAVKTGMLATGDVVDLVADHAAAFPHLVVDPVIVAASGDRLLAEEGVASYERLVADATLVTPNADEAEVLTGVAVEDPDSAERAGRILVAEYGANAALVKGGHVPGEQVVDTLVTSSDGESGGDSPAVTAFSHDRVDTDATHGAGCTLSSAVATHLAHGDDLATAVGAGIDLLGRAVRYNVAVGEGSGSVHHLAELRNDASRAATIDLVHLLADRFREEDCDALAPATGVGLAAATPHAEEPDDVAAVVGRLAPGASSDTSDSTDSTADAGTRGQASVRFGADHTLAGFLVAARDADPAVRFGALLATDPAALDALDGDVVSLGADRTASAADGVVNAAGLPEPDAFAALASASDTPVAVAFDGERDVVDEPSAIVFAETTAELFRRLAELAGT